MRRFIYIFFLFFSVISNGQIDPVLAVEISRLQATPTGAVPVIESYATNSYDTNSTSIVLDKPTGLVVGDLLLVFCIDDGPDVTTAQWSTSSDPAGWTFLRSEQDVDSDSSIGLFWKIADSGDVSATDYTFTSVGAFDKNGGILRISGINDSTPIGVQGTFTSDAGNTTDDIQGITTLNDYSLVVGILAMDGADTAPFSVSGTGWSEVGELVSVSIGNDGNSAVWASKAMPTAGATGNATVTASENDGIGSFMIEIRSE